MVKTDEQISQLMDGELDEAAAQRLLTSLRQPGRQGEWHTYHLIGDVLRDTPVLGDDFMARFSASLANEPTVLAPRRLNRHSPRAIALSAAASVAAVSLVVWAVMQTGMNPVHPTADALIVAKAPPVVPPVSANVNPYLLAHQEHSPSVAMQGMATYIRTVSEFREVAAR